MSEDLIVIVVKDLDNEARHYLGNDGELFLAPSMKNAMIFYSLEEAQSMMRRLAEEPLSTNNSGPPKLGPLTRLLARIGPQRKSARVEVTAQLLVPTPLSQFSMDVTEEISRPMDLWVTAIRNVKPLQEINADDHSV